MSDRWAVHHGDCREVMQAMEPESIDSIVSDPPYGLSFMGKGWDHGVPGVEFWEAALRVAKPGCHLLAFGGTRTFHRLTVAIEDAGWEIRDCLMWVYGSGFPKSHDVSKAIDREAGAEREVVGLSLHSANRTAGSWQHGDRKTGIAAGNEGNRMLTAPATDAARQWQGWGTALKPSYEPIILARKPLSGTVAANVLEHGTGAINVDGCRVGTEHVTTKGRSDKKHADSNSLGANWSGNVNSTPHARWPANLIHDGSDEVVGLMAEAARFFYCAKASKRDRDEGCEGLEERQYSHDGRQTQIENAYQRNNSVSRNHHPTVKPTDLMRYLCRLITPPDGLVFDPFTGSGSTGKAAMLEGFRFVGAEQYPEYIEIARARIGHAAGKTRQKELALA